MMQSDPRSKVLGIFLIFMAGAVVNLGLAEIFHNPSDIWTGRIVSVLAMSLAYLYWDDKLPRRKS